ncbi:phage holin family protein [Cetobacterium sp. 2A]|nr:phage holin family protein [Cetobacterium sp. 2A]MBC2855276.1 phage holin family protein [Cetobacterium sp. 2A]MBC2855638.1 phage holin family protein [Cetobacterium sp. 2A]
MKTKTKIKIEVGNIKETLDNLLLYTQGLFFWLGAGFASAVGGIDGDIRVLFCLTIIDCATGLLKAIKEKNVLSKNMFIGFIIRKPAIYLAIATMAQLDKATFLNDINISLRVCMITGCIIMESISIMENLTKLGIKLPGLIENILAVKKQKLDQ